VAGPPPPASPAPLTPVRAVAIVGVLVLVGWLALLVEPTVAGPPTAWPPDGIALGLLLVLGLRAWPLVFAGTAAIELLARADPGLVSAPPILVGIALAASDTLEAVLGAVLMRRALSEPGELRLERDVMLFLFVIAPTAALADAVPSTLLYRSIGTTAGTSLGQLLAYWGRDLIGIVAFTPITLALLAPRDSAWRERRAAVVLPLLLATVAVALLHRERRATDLESARADFERQATELLQRASGRLSAHVDGLVSLATVRQELQGISRVEFSAFARRVLTNQRGWRGVDWVAVVPSARRARAEADARSEGRDDFVIRELAPADSGRPAPARPVYYPVLYSEPAERSWRMRGRDYASDPGVIRLLAQAAELEHPVASGLTNQPGDSAGRVILVAQAVPGVQPGGPPEGFVVGLLDPAGFLDALVPAGLAHALRLELYDSIPGVGSLPLYATNVDVPAQGFWTETVLPAPGRVWVLRARAPVESFARSHGWASPVLLLLGILLVTILAGLLLVTSGRPAILIRLMEDLSLRQREVERELRARKEAEAELAALEQRWAFALEASGTGVWEHDVVSGTAYLSPQWKAFLGYGPAELEDSIETWRSRIHPDDLESVVAGYTAHQEGRSPLFESTHRIRGRDGSWRWVLARGGAMERAPDGAPRRILGTFTDLTARRLAELALEESEQRFRLLVESISEVFWMTTPDGRRYTYLSPAFEQVWGIKREAALEDPSLWQRTVLPEDLPRLLSSVGFREGGTSEVEYRIRRPDGQLRWIHERVFPVRDAAGRVVAIGGVSTDVSRRRRAESDLRSSEERFRRLVEHAPDGILILRGTELQYANPAFVALVGAASPAELAGRSVADLLQPDHAAQFRERLAALREGGAVPAFPTVLRRLDGATVDVEAAATAVPAAEDPVIQVMVRDVSQVRLHQALLRESERKYRALIETTGTGYVIFDREGRVLDANREYLRLTGRADLGQVIGQPVTTWTRAEDRPRTQEALRRCLAEGTIRHLETDYVGPGGRRIPVEVNATVLVGSGGLQVLGLCRDITERREAQEALAESARFVEQVLDTFPGPIAVRDAGGRFRLVNRVLADELGTTKEALVGQTPPARPHVLANTATALDREVLTGRVTRSTDEPFRANGQGTHWYHVIRTPLIRGDGEVLLLQMGLDITARREAEEAFRELNAELEDRVRERTAELERLNGMLREAEAALSQENHYLEALNQLALALLAREDPEVVLRALVQSACGLTGVSGGMLRVRDEEGVRFASRIAWGEVPESWRVPTGRGEGISGRVWDTGGPVLVPDYAGWPYRHPAKDPTGVVGVAAVPLRSGGDIVGALLAVQAPGDPAVGDDTPRILERFAQLAVLVLDHASLQVALQEELDERRRAEARQRRLAADLVEAQRVGRVGSWTWDPGQGALHGSEELLRLLGLPAERGRVTLAEWAALHHPDERDGARRTLMELAVAPRPGPGGDRAEWDARIIRPDGRTRILRVAVERHRDATGQVLRLYGTCQDITEEREAAEQLWRQARELAEAQRVGRTGSWSWDRGADRLTWSEELYRLYGTEPAGAPLTFDWWLARIHPDDREHARTTVVALLQGGDAVEWDFRILHPDGSAHTLHTRAEVQRNAAGEAVRLFGISQDITERLAMERALRESEARYRLALRSTVDGVWDWPDVAAEEVLLSPRCYELLGYEPGAFTPSASLLREQLLHPDDATQAEAAVRRHLDEGTPLEVDLRLRHKDGGWRWFRVRGEALREGGRPTRMAGSLQDIDPGKRAELELARSRALFTVFVEQSPTICYLKDAESRLRYVNKAFIDAMWRGRAPEWRGRSDFELWPMHLAAEYYASEQRVLATGRAEVVEEEVVRDGEVETWLNFKFPLTVPGGDQYLAGMAVNLTAQKRAEAEVRRLNAELEERVRRRTADLEAANQELESFSYSVSHDLRTPLRAIDGFCQALLEDYATRLDDTGRGYLTRVRAASQRMGGLIDDLLQLSRLTRGEIHLSSLDLTGLAVEVASELQAADPGRAVEVRIAPGLRAPGDPVLVRVVLANLLGNAWKFTARRPNARIEFARADTPHGPAFLVRDNGVGFDPRYAGKLFGPFQRLHPRDDFEGSGIGLATVQRILRRHGGRAWADARPGEGATFYFTLGPEGGD
jgi:PAS domain S-box-containing protein